LKQISVLAGISTLASQQTHKPVDHITQHDSEAQQILNNQQHM